jgi:hypothetical protein
LDRMVDLFEFEVEYSHAMVPVGMVIAAKSTVFGKAEGHNLLLDGGHIARSAPL